MYSNVQHVPADSFRVLGVLLGAGDMVVTTGHDFYLRRIYSLEAETGT